MANATDDKKKTIESLISKLFYNEDVKKSLSLNGSMALPQALQYIQSVAIGIDEAITFLEDDSWIMNTILETKLVAYEMWESALSDETVTQHSMDVIVSILELFDKLAETCKIYTSEPTPKAGSGMNTVAELRAIHSFERDDTMSIQDLESRKYEIVTDDGLSEVADEYELPDNVLRGIVSIAIPMDGYDDHLYMSDDGVNYTRYTLDEDEW